MAKFLRKIQRAKQTNLIKNLIGVMDKYEKQLNVMDRYLELVVEGLLVEKGLLTRDEIDLAINKAVANKAPSEESAPIDPVNND